MTYSTIPESRNPHHNPQTVKAWQSEENGEIVAIESGVTHGKRYTVTRFAAPFWETYEPLEYHGSYNDLSEAEEKAIEVLESL